MTTTSRGAGTLTRRAVPARIRTPPLLSFGVSILSARHGDVTPPGRVGDGGARLHGTPTAVPFAHERCKGLARPEGSGERARASARCSPEKQAPIAAGAAGCDAPPATCHSP